MERKPLETDAQFEARRRRIQEWIDAGGLKAYSLALTVNPPPRVPSILTPRGYRLINLGVQNV
ncbi:MAG: hypothetical protein KGL39_54315 [Patescibacteria group bacterium]|nr:hypothetical protein [Patescibacteria group bacterium]